MCSLRCYDQYGISALVSQTSFRLEPVAASRNVGWFLKLVKNISANVMQYGGKCNHELTRINRRSMPQFAVHCLKFSLLTLLAFYNESVYIAIWIFKWEYLRWKNLFQSVLICLLSGAAFWCPSFHINSKQVFVLNSSRLPSHWFALKTVIFIIVIGCGLDLFLIRGLILQICVLSHSEPRHTTANQKPNYKDFGIYRKIKKESCLCAVC